MKCRLCFTPLKKIQAEKEELSVEDFYITKKSSKRVSLIICRNCGLVQANGLIPPEKLLECYQRVEDLEVEKEFLGRKLAFRRDILKCLAIINKRINSILEVGAFTGIAAEAIGEVLPKADYLGIEPSSWACGVAQKRGKNVIQGKIGDPIDRIFDLIFAWDVIEHLEYPHDFFKWCNDLTTQGSYLFINTPNWESGLHRVFGKKWWFIEPMHRTYFTPKTLTLIAEQHQWKMIKIWRHMKIVSMPYLIHRAVKEYLNLDINILRRLPHVKVSLYIGQMSVLLKRA
jgi:2-polyprenyl-3-methyl-5-hydroxy-6-metoxy-1,4-benzoquinol methylase